VIRCLRHRKWRKWRCCSFQHSARFHLICLWSACFSLSLLSIHCLHQMSIRMRGMALVARALFQIMVLSGLHGLVGGTYELSAIPTVLYAYTLMILSGPYISK
jgi:hypothetical protein